MSPWYVTTKGLACNLKANLATAKKLITASGLATPIKVQITIGTDPVAARLGQVIQSMEKQIGIDVELKPTEFVASLSAADAGKFDCFAIGWSGRVDPDGNIYGFVSTPGHAERLRLLEPEAGLHPQRRAQVRVREVADRRSTRRR